MADFQVAGTTVTLAVSVVRASTGYGPTTCGGNPARTSDDEREDTHRGIAVTLRGLA